MKTANQGLEGSAEERSSVPVALRAPAPPQPRRSPSHHAILSALEFTRHTECDLKVTRIVRNIESQDLAQAQRFYGDILGLDLMMDLGWIRTYGSKEMMAVQISLLAEGGSGTPVPELSIEVDDIEEAFLRMRAANVASPPSAGRWGSSLGIKSGNVRFRSRAAGESQGLHLRSGHSSEPVINFCLGRPNASLRVGHDASRHVDVAAKPGSTLLSRATIAYAQIS